MDALDKENCQILSLLHPHVRDLAMQVYQEMFKIHGARMRCTRSYSDLMAQDSLYQQGRVTPGPIVTWARPGYSLHNYWCAFDSCFAGRDPYLDILRRSDSGHAELLWEGFMRICETHGVTPGGRWMDEHQDRPHAQYTFGLKLPVIQELFRTGGKELLFKKFDEIQLQKDQSAGSIK